MYGNTANMVETRSEPESYELEFMPLVTSCGSRLPRWPFTDLGLLVFMPCVGRFPTVGGTSRIQQKWCYGTSKSRLWKTLWFPILSLRSFSLGRLQPCGEKRQARLVRNWGFQPTTSKDLRPPAKPHEWAWTWIFQPSQAFRWLQSLLTFCL